MAMQFKTMTQMTQMTQGHADKITWACWRQPATCGTVASGRRPGPPAGQHGRQHSAWGTRAGPAAKGRQKRTDREQFFFSQNFANSSKFFNFYFLL